MPRTTSHLVRASDPERGDAHALAKPLQLRGVFDAERIVLSALQVPDRRHVPGERRPHQRLHRVWLHLSFPSVPSDASKGTQI